LGNRPRHPYSVLGGTTVAVYFLIPGDDKTTLPLNTSREFVSFCKPSLPGTQLHVSSLYCSLPQRCDKATKETFTCIPGVEGGGKPLLPPRHLCTTSYVGHPGTFPFFCVHKDNSAFLGFFYPIEAAKREKQSVVSAISSHKPEYSYA